MLCLPSSVGFVFFTKHFSLSKAPSQNIFLYLMKEYRACLLRWEKRKDAQNTGFFVFVLNIISTRYSGMFTVLLSKNITSIFLFFVLLCTCTQQVTVSKRNSVKRLAKSLLQKNGIKLNIQTGVHMFTLSWPLEL